MNDFEFLAGFFGVLLGLVIAQSAAKLAEAIDELALGLCGTGWVGAR